MIAMQYSFTLPADYDMTIVDRRIGDKGSMMDGFPNLRFKAYLSASKGEFGSRENLYAPFYLWKRPDGASDFLTGPGFQGLTQSFGWPQVIHWLVWNAEIADLRAAKFASRDILPIPAYAPLAEIRKQEVTRSNAEAAERGVLATISAFEPSGWSLVRFTLYRDMPLIFNKDQIYRVGHVSLP
ncbi:hypothetical protein AM571_CH03430 [Rhizobium etli 8C-3]|uniref:DUF4865 domain-containing protein n=2 Tax=Rhizobium TaxID=379 RepID=A0A1L5P831_RHIET|nr:MULTISPECIES: DUF4865 family protein [Rhizobium]APO76222.1 hypothetical protein AM571_CH03430 [Rhizobium etli 8C-3]TCU35563.1 uncharacterized protein DUF4865 [Rhizobium azibense]